MNNTSKKYIATVNGEKIDFKVFQSMYSIEIERQKKILGKNFIKFSQNKKFIQETYNHILSQLINNILLEQYTKKINLQIDDNEIKKIILNSSEFQKNQKFNKEKYFNYLAAINLTHNEYINIIKKKINTEHLINVISASNFILEDEKKNIIKLLSQTRKIKKAIVKIDSIIQKQNVNDIEAKSYFYKNKNHFYIPEKIKVSFIELTPDKFKKNCKIEEINKEYLKNIKKYIIKEQRRYSIIQIKNKDEALSILSELKNKPEYFSKIASEKSMDPISSKKGGDIGWISIDSIPNEIAKANLNKKNQISNVISFQNQFIIVKLSDILPSKQKKINEVYDTIKKEIEYKKSLNIYNKVKNKISILAKKNSNQFDLILKKINIPISETNFFDKNSIPKTLNLPVLKKILFNKNLINKNKKEIISYSNFIILKNHQSFFIKIQDFKEKKMQVFEDVKKNIIKKLQIIKGEKEAKKISEKIIAQLKKGDKTIFKQLNLHFKSLETISRYDENPIVPIVFSLPYPEKKEKIFTLYQDENKNFVIISLEKIDYKKFSKEEENIIFKYLENNNNEIIFNAILKNLREKAIIKYEKIEKK